MNIPDWIKKENIKMTLDARPLLASGQHPLEMVITETGNLEPGEIYELLSPFPPMPMIDKLESLGFMTFSGQDETGVFHTYFLKR